MAAPIRNVLRTVFKHQQTPVCAIWARGCGRYSKEFVDHTTGLEDLNSPLAEDDIRNFSKIKAAPLDDTTFTNYDPLVNSFTNMIIMDGKKKLARNIAAKMLENIKHIQVERYHRAIEKGKPTDAIELDPVKIFHQAIENGKPMLVTTKTLVAGTYYQVPGPCPESRQLHLSLRWLADVSMIKNDRMERFYDRLAYEVLDAYNGQGKLIKKKQDMHKLCESNIAYAHYRWSK